METFEVAVIDEQIISSGEDMVASIKGVKFLKDPNDPESVEDDFEMMAIASLIYGKNEHNDAVNDDKPLKIGAIEFGDNMIAYFGSSLKKYKHSVNPMAMMIVHPDIFKSADIDMMELSKNIKKSKVDKENVFLFGKIVIAKVGPNRFKPMSIDVTSFMKELSAKMTDVTAIIKAGKKITDEHGNVIGVKPPTSFKGVPGFSNN